PADSGEQRAGGSRSGWRGIIAALAIAEVLGIHARVAEVVVDEHRGLAGELETLAAFVAGDQIIETDHVGGGAGELAAVFLTGAAGQFPFFSAHLPAHRSFEFAAAARADELDFARLLFFRVKAAFVHRSSAFT